MGSTKRSASRPAHCAYEVKFFRTRIHDHLFLRTGAVRKLFVKRTTQLGISPRSTGDFRTAPNHVLPQVVRTSHPALQQQPFDLLFAVSRIASGCCSASDRGRVCTSGAALRALPPQQDPSPRADAASDAIFFVSSDFAFISISCYNRAQKMALLQSQSTIEYIGTH